MQRLYSSIIRFMPLIFWLLVAIVSSLMLIELKPSTDGIPNIDKVEHAFVFILLTITGGLAYSKYKARVYIGLIALGALYEVLQALFTVTRQASVYDWLADIFGILIAIGIMPLISKLSKQNKNLA
jgi:VanZ family protein